MHPCSDCELSQGVDVCSCKLDMCSDWVACKLIRKIGGSGHAVNGCRPNAQTSQLFSVSLRMALALYIVSCSMLIRKVGGSGLVVYGFRPNTQNSQLFSISLRMALACYIFSYSMLLT